MGTVGTSLGLAAVAGAYEPKRFDDLVKRTLQTYKHLPHSMSPHDVNGRRLTPKDVKFESKF